MRINKIITLIIVAALAVSANAGFSYEKLNDADVWLMGGQSNMVGNGEIEQDVPVNPEVFAFYMDNRWGIAKVPLTRIYEATAPVHIELMMKKFKLDEKAMAERRGQSRLKPIGKVGPGFFFADCLQRELQKPIAVIPSAHGGTNMAQWAPELKKLGSKSLYGAMLERVKLSRAGANLKGLIWYQGESEAMRTERAEAYEQVFSDFIDALRQDLGRPDFPIIIVQVGRYCRGNTSEQDRKNWQSVREAQRKIAKTKSNVFAVPAIDLELDDGIHLSMKGQKRLGSRLAHTALSKVYKLKTAHTPIMLERIEVIGPKTSRPRVHLYYEGVNGKLQSGSTPPTGFTMIRKEQSSAYNDLYRIEFDDEAANKIILRFDKPLQDNTMLIYAPGLNPYCNIIDDGDMTPLAFGPIELP